MADLFCQFNYLSYICIVIKNKTTMTRKYYQVSTQRSNIPIFIEENQSSIDVVINDDFITDNYQDAVISESITEISENEFNEAYKHIVSFDKNKSYRIFINDFSNETEKSYKANSYEDLLKLIHQSWTKAINENEWRIGTHYYAKQIMHENQLILYNEFKDGIIYTMDISVCE